MNATQVFRSLAAAAALLVIAGCSGSEPPPPREEFGPNDSSRPIWQSMDRQSALAARQEATLHAADFDGGQLNGLGRAHLDEMMAEKPGPAIVYVDVNPQDAMSSAQRDAVTQYINQMEGSTPTRVEFGANWSQSFRAKESITRLPKTENPSRGGGAHATGGSSNSSSTSGNSQQSDSMTTGGNSDR